MKRRCQAMRFVLMSIAVNAPGVISRTNGTESVTPTNDLPPEYVPDAAGIALYADCVSCEQT